MSLKKINKIIGSKEAKIKWSMEKLLRNDDSLIFCDKCKNRLGIITMIHFALGKKKGEPYTVVCKSCNHLNKRVKGDLCKNIDSDWDKYGV